MLDTRRLDDLERTTAHLTERLEQLEGRLAAAERRTAPWSLATPERPAEPTPVATAWARQLGRVPRTAATTQRPALEDVVGGRVLAWAGGVAVLVGIVLLFAVAVSRGWIGEGARTLMGGLASLSLVVVGAWLHERRGRTDAALAAASAGVGGLFVTTVVASRVYGLVAVEAGMLVALATGALATALALRWRALGIAALGILGGLLAPVAVGAPQDGGTMAILFAATLSATAVCVGARWGWLAAAAYAIVAPQWVAYVIEDAATLPALAALAGFGALAAATAVALAMREHATPVPPVAAVLLTVNAAVLAAAGQLALDGSALWLVALAASHIVLGLALLRARRASRAIGVLGCTLGAVLADAAVAELLSGPAVTIAWAAVAVGFAGLLRFAAGVTLDGAEAAAGLGVLLGLSVARALTLDAPPSALVDGLADPAGAALALAACAGAAASLAFVFGARADVRRTAAAATAALLALHLASTELVTAAGTAARAQALLSALWGVVGVTALVAGLVRDIAPLRTGALALLLTALAKVFLYDLSTLTPIARVVSFIALGLLLLAGAFVWQRVRPRAQLIDRTP